MKNHTKQPVFLLIGLFLLALIITSCQSEKTPIINFVLLRYQCNYKLDDPSIGDGYIRASFNVEWPQYEEESSEKLKDWIKTQIITIQDEKSEEDNSKASKDNKSALKIMDSFEGRNIEDLLLERIKYIRSTANKKNPITQVSISCRSGGIKRGKFILYFRCTEEYADKRKSVVRIAKSEIQYEFGGCEVTDEKELHNEDYSLLYKYQPRLREYSYKFDKNLITQSSNLTNGDWESAGYYGEANVVMNKLAEAQFDGIDVGDLYGFTSNIYDSLFRNQPDYGHENNQSVRVNIFRHPKTGLPMIAVNGRLVNSDRLNVYPHENGYGVDISFRCLREHPVLDLDGDDKDYPNSIPPNLFLYKTSNPFKWNQPNAEQLFFAIRRVNETKEKYGESLNYYEAVRKMEIVDTAYNEDKYFFVNINIHNPQKNPSMSLDFDNRRFALTCTNNRRKLEEGEISNLELRDIEKYGFGKYEHKIVANNTNIDPLNIEGSVNASNLGMYGKSEVGTEQIIVGRDIYVDGKFYGRIFEIKPSSSGYTFYLFRNGKPNNTEILEIPKREKFNGEIILTKNRRAAHLKKL